MTVPLTNPSTGETLQSQRWGSSQLFRRPPPRAGVEGFCIHCYDPEVFVVADTTTYETFLRFVVPAHEVKPGRAVYVQWTCSINNDSGGPAVPNLLWVWGTSAQTFEYTGLLQPATWPDLGGPPFDGQVQQIWAVMLQRHDTDEEDSDGRAYVFNPCGGDPLGQPCLSPDFAPAGAWGDINFGIDQLVELQIKWDVADPQISMAPDTALAMCYGSDMLVDTSSS